MSELMRLFARGRSPEPDGKSESPVVTRQVSEDAARLSEIVTADLARNPVKHLLTGMSKDQAFKPGQFVRTHLEMAYMTSSKD